MLQPHEHIARAHPGKAGDPMQVFPPRKRRLTAWDVISTVVTVTVFLVLLFALPWEGGW
jgi:hypothetical protein